MQLGQEQKVGMSFHERIQDTYEINTIDIDLYENDMFIIKRPFIDTFIHTYTILIARLPLYIYIYIYIYIYLFLCFMNGYDMI